MTRYVVSILVAWYLVVFGVVHLVSALAGPKLPWWWTGLLLGIVDLVLGVWAVHSWQRSLFTLTGAPAAVRSAALLASWTTGDPSPATYRPRG